MTEGGLLRAIPRRPGLVPIGGARDTLSAKHVNLLTMTENDVYTGWPEVDTFEGYQRAWAAIKA